jgi:N utilization substance protein A
VDIILWDENLAQFVVNAMSPAEVSSIVIDEESGVMDIAVPHDKLSQAIGRGGQNIKLASQLTGWTLNVMDESEAETKSEEETRKLAKVFMDQLDVDEEVAIILVQEGLSSVDEVAYVPASELLEIEEFDEEMVEELRGRARDALLTMAIASEESVELNDPGPPGEPKEDLLNMELMTPEIAATLSSHGILSMEDLADQAVDDIEEYQGLNRELAAQLIMKAREPWFAEKSE